MQPTIKNRRGSRPREILSREKCIRGEKAKEMVAPKSSVRTNVCSELKRILFLRPVLVPVKYYTARVDIVFALSISRLVYRHNLHPFILVRPSSEKGGHCDSCEWSDASWHIMHGSDHFRPRNFPPSWKKSLSSLPSIRTLFSTVGK